MSEHQLCLECSLFVKIPSLLFSNLILINYCLSVVTFFHNTYCISTKAAVAMAVQQGLIHNIGQHL